jgi:hypothetical protein
MPQPLGSCGSLSSCCDAGQAAAQTPVFTAGKKKGCKQKKCSNWKGGKCRCGRE